MSPGRLTAAAVTVAVIAIAIVVFSPVGSSIRQQFSGETAELDSLQSGPNASADGSNARGLPENSFAPMPMPSSDPDAALTPLVSFPLPASASATGALAEGFPSDVIPLAPGSAPESSSVESDGKYLRSSLIATSTDSADSVLEHYREVFAVLGFVSAPVPAVPGSEGVAFAREPDSVTLTVTSTGTGSSYAILASFEAG